MSRQMKLVLFALPSYVIQGIFLQRSRVNPSRSKLAKRKTGVECF